MFQKDNIGLQKIKNYSNNSITITLSKIERNLRS